QETRSASTPRLSSPATAGHGGPGRDSNPQAQETPMSKKTVFNVPNMDRDMATAAGTLQVMTYPKGMSFKVDIEFDSKMEKEIAKDAMMLRDMNVAGQTVYSDLLNAIGKNLKTTNKGAVQLRDSNQLAKMQKLVEVVNKNIEGAKRVAEERAAK